MSGRTTGLVLIADDDAATAEMVSFMVEEAGYTPRVAAHGREALELARAEPPALLITDLLMPHLDGADLIAALHADAAIEDTPAPPTILLTGASLEQALATDADVVLQKPFELTELEALLHRFLEER